MNFKYSAVITTFNGEKTFLSALLSICKQTIPPEEIIIVDDNLTEHKSKYVLSAIENVTKGVRNYPNAIYHKNYGNLGVSHSRNLGISNCKTDYIIFFDDDDESDPLRAKEHATLFQDGSDINYVSSIKLYNTQYTKKFINTSFLGKILHSSLFDKTVLGEGGVTFPILYVASSTLAIKKIIVTSDGGFDINLKRLEDVDFALIQAKNSRVFAFSSKILVSRSSTDGDHKSPLIEFESQSIILKKHGESLSRYKKYKYLILFKLTQYYFESNYILFFFLSILKILFFGLKFRNLSSFWFRLRHDYNIKGIYR